MAKLKKPKTDNLVELAQYYQHRQERAGKLAIISFLAFFAFVLICFIIKGILIVEFYIKTGLWPK